MTPNPTARPFILGALMFLCVLVGWPGGVKAGRTPSSRCQLQVQNRTVYRVLVHVDGVYYGWVSPHHSFTFKVPPGDSIVYGTTQFAEYFWGPKALRCQERASWDLTF